MLKRSQRLSAGGTSGKTWPVTASITLYFSGHGRSTVLSETAA